MKNKINQKRQLVYLKIKLFCLYFKINKITNKMRLKTYLIKVCLNKKRKKNRKGCLILHPK